MTKNSNHIQLKNINFKVNKKLFFKNINLNLSSTGITVILGPNGSGKSLLTKIIKGLIEPDSGDLSIKLNNIKPLSSYLSQDIVFFRRDVFSNLAYPMKINGYSKNSILKRINFLLDHFEFKNVKGSARRLSEGNKQYLAFIRALVNKPKLLILDEPSSNLDMNYTKKIEDYLIRNKEDIKIIMVTHDIFQAKRLADEILFMNNGEVIEISKKMKFLKSKNILVKKFLSGSFF